jgi:hypothetical protein
MMGRIARKRLAEYEAISLTIRDFGGLREPEIAAALGWSEERVRLALREPLKLGWLVRDRESGEVRRLPPLAER